MRNILLEHVGRGNISHQAGIYNEYTLCGLAIPDSTLEVEGFQVVKNQVSKTIDCSECHKVINLCKSIPSNHLSKTTKNPF